MPRRASDSVPDTCLAELREQPEALRRLVDARADVEAVAEALARRGGEVVRLVAHGSSDAAASYGGHVFGLLPGWAAFRHSISLSTSYRADLDFPRSAGMALAH